MLLIYTLKIKNQSHALKISKYPLHVIKYQNNPHTIQNHQNQSSIPLILKSYNKKDKVKPIYTKNQQN